MIQPPEPRDRDEIPDLGDGPSGGFGRRPPPDLPPRRPAGSMVIPLILAVSLLGNAVLSSRLRETESALTDVRARLDRTAGELEEARGRLRRGGPDAPISTIASIIEDLRGLSFKRRVRPELLSPADLASRIRSLTREEYDRDEIEASERVLLTLGVWPEDKDLYRELVRFQTDNVAGFYDSRRRELVVAASDARSPSPFARAVLAHELTHALADQHFDLRRLDRLQDDRKDDEAMAFLALVEGDAEMVRTLYQRHVLTDEERLRLFEEASDLAGEDLGSQPPYLQRVFQFPYVEGTKFVEALHRRGGFDLVDRAYRRPPRSTEQILHPERYAVRRDDPTRVVLPNLTRAMGSGWRALESGGFGELDARLVVDLGGTGLSGSDAEDLSSGWDGGGYQAIARGDDTLVAMLTTWDGLSEAREAANLFGRWLPLRYDNQGQRVEVSGGGSGWQSRAGAGLVLRDEGRVLVLLGPDSRTLARARSAFRGF